MSEPAIAARGVRKTYEEGRITALAGMDLEVAEGEFVAVVGPSGCGKSTLLHLLAGLDRPDAGTIRVAHHDLGSGRDLSHYRAHHVGMVFQLHNLLPALTAAENVQVPMFELRVGARERRERARRLLAAVGLETRARSRPPQLSGGERQRVAIARALANEPPILLADEPTGSLDSEAGRHVLDLIDELRRERGLTVVLVTHDHGVAARADRIVRMLDGRAIGPGLPPEQDAEHRDRDRRDERRAADEHERRARRRRLAGPELAREPRAEHEVVHDRQDDQRRDEDRLREQLGAELGVEEDVGVVRVPVAGEQEAGDDQHGERAPAERPPPPAERAQGGAALLLRQAPDHGDAGERERDRAADPDGGREQVEDEQGVVHAGAG
jgi:putative ABC transport system ATP-binding protein